MLASIRRFRLFVIALAIIGLGTGLGVSASQHSGYKSTELILAQANARHNMQDQLVIIGSRMVLAAAHANKQQHIGMSLDELQSSISAARYTNSIISITAVGASPAQAVITVRTVTASYVRVVHKLVDTQLRQMRAAERRAGAAQTPMRAAQLRVLDGPTKAAAIQANPSVIAGLIGLGAGLALGLLLAAALGAFASAGPKPALA